jgi:hypothetical protein
MSKNPYLWKLQELYNDPTFKEYEDRGLISRVYVHGRESKANTNRDNYNTLMGQLDALKKQDDTISREYKLVTNKDISREQLLDLSKVTDPALRAAIIQKQAATATPVGNYATSIDQAIQAKLGRAATDAEKQYFGKAMESGQLDPYTLNTFIENTNEYQMKASDVARGKLASELQGVDTQYLGEVEKALQRQYAAQGRQGSSAFGSAMIKAGQDLAKGRTDYLAGLGYQDFQRGQSNLRADYENALRNQYAAQQQSAALGQESRNRYYAQQDFNRQLNAQMRLAEMSKPKQGSFLESLIPGLVQTGGNLAAAYITRGGSAMAQPSGYGGGMYNTNPKMNIYNPWG